MSRKEDASVLDALKKLFMSDRILHSILRNKTGHEQ